MCREGHPCACTRGLAPQTRCLSFSWLLLAPPRARRRRAPRARLPGEGGGRWQFSPNSRREVSAGARTRRRWPPKRHARAEQAGFSCAPALPLETQLHERGATAQTRAGSDVARAWGGGGMSGKDWHPAPPQVCGLACTPAPSLMKLVHAASPSVAVGWGDARAARGGPNASQRTDSGRSAHDS